MIQLTEITKVNFNKAVTFVSLYEQSCCGLTSHLKKIAQTIITTDKFYFIEENSSTIYGIIAIFNKKFCTFCLPCFNKANNIFYSEEIILEIDNLLKIFFSDIKLYCISGEKNGSEFLQKVYNHSPKNIFNYELRLFNSKNIITNECKNMKQQNFSIVRCNIHDSENLFQLQKEYDIEEVIPPDELFNGKNCKTHLISILQTEIIFAIKINNNFISKAGTNAQGFNYFQIGGVFTDKLFRGKGYACALVQYLTAYILKLNKKPVLFVKQNNLCAKAAYTKAGYSPIGEYQIVYYP